MKILLATPIYPPEIGGPAQYVKNLEIKLKEKGIETEIISYNNLKKYPQPLRFFLYFSEIFKKTKNSQIIYAFNLVSCGLPAYFSSKILGKKFILRLGGDFLWERAVESGKTKKTLSQYYQEPKSFAEKFWIFKIKRILNGADRIIFTSNFQKEIYQKYFNIKDKKIIVIKNPFLEIKTSNSQSSIINYQLLYAGRLIKLKNLDGLIDAFARVNQKNEGKLILKIIGQGPEKQNLEFKIKNLKLENKVLIQKPLPHQELLKEIQRSYLCVLPSLTEISPNFALECIKLKKPILLTKETGIYEDFKNYLIFIDPQNINDLEEKINFLLDEKNYKDYIEKIKAVPVFYSWSQVIEKHILMFKELIKVKKVLFISVTEYNLNIKERHSHLEKKFEGLSRGVITYVLAKGKPFHRKIWGTEFYLLSYSLFWPLAFFFAFYLCLVKKVDIVICQSPLLEGFLGSILKKLLKKELVVEVHGDWQEGPFLSKKRKFEFLERKIIPFLAQTSFKNADKIRVISNYLKEKVEKIVSQKPYFIFPTFTDIDLFLNEKNANFENYILFVGQLEKVKGIEYLVEAFAKINSDFPKFKLIIIGDGSEKQNLEFIINNLGLKEKIELKGKLSLEEIKNVMRNCYCLVLPSLSEGLGRVLMEAQALSKPVIGSNVGGIPNLIKDGQSGFLFEKSNSEQLAQKLKILLKDKNLAIEMGKKGREFVKEKFSNEKYIFSYIEMINS